MYIYLSIIFQYCVVKFIEEEAVEYVPCSWLVGAGKCKWPQKDSIKARRRMILPDVSWEEHDVKIYVYCDTIEEALEQCKLHEFSSCLDSQSENENRRCKPNTAALADRAKNIWPKSYPVNFNNRATRDHSSIASDVVAAARLADRPKDIGLKSSAVNLNLNKRIARDHSSIALSSSSSCVQNSMPELLSMGRSPSHETNNMVVSSDAFLPMQDPSKSSIRMKIESKLGYNLACIDGIVELLIAQQQQISILVEQVKQLRNAIPASNEPFDNSDAFPKIEDWKRYLSVPHSDVERHKLVSYILYFLINAAY